MALFKRKNQTTIAELEDYYANQRGRRTGMAWFMAFLSLLITVAVILALFFGGRWLYRTFIDDGQDDTTTDTTVTTDDGVELPSFDGSLPNQPTVTDGTQVPDDAAVGTVEPDGVVSDEAATTDTSNNGATAGTSITATGDIPNTGAGETIVVLLVGTTVLGYFIHRRLLTRSR